MRNRSWFRSNGWIHYPITWQGILLYGCMFVFFILTFRSVDQHSHSASDTLFGIFPFWIPAYLLIEWVASKTSKN